MDAQGQLIVLAECYSQQLDFKAKLPGVLKISGSQTGNPFPVYVLIRDLGVKGKRGQNGQLVSGIFAFNVVGRIRFGVAQRLGVAQRRFKVQPILGHPGQYVVGRAVYDGMKRGEFIGQKVFAQGAYDGYPPRYARFVQKIEPGFLRKLQKLLPTGGHDLFVCGNNVLPLSQGRPEVSDSRVHAAHKLNYYVHIRIINQRSGVRGQQSGFYGQTPLSGGIAHQDTVKLQGPTHVLCPALRFAQECLGNLGPDHAQAKQTYSNFAFAVHEDVKETSLPLELECLQAGMTAPNCSGTERCWSTLLSC